MQLPSAPLSLLAAALLALAAGAETNTPFRFEDVTASAGLAPALTNWELGHAAAWGDVNGDGRLDLYFGSFADRPVYFSSNAPAPNMLWLNTGTGFVHSVQPALEMRGTGNRASSAVFADLDNDGDLDLIQGQHVAERTDDPDTQKPAGIPQGSYSSMFENTGGGIFRLVPDFGPWPPRIGARNIAPLDLDRDGRLDLVVNDGSYENKKGGAHLRILRNLGKFQFEDVTAKWGLPEKGTLSLGLAVGDVNEDGRPDLFAAGSNRLFLSTADGRFQEGAFAPLVRVYMSRRDRNGFFCGAAFGDLNGDGRLDLVVTLHSIPARLYVLFNESSNAVPQFVDRSAELGLDRRFPTTTPSGAVMKSAHVELRDMDNDGRLDIVLAALYTATNGLAQPIILRNLGGGALPRFSELPLDRMAGYYAPGPVADFDGDGRLDLFLPSWFKPSQVPTRLFRNVTPSGHYLAVRVRDAAGKRNPMGVGAVARAYRTGHAGAADHLIQRGDLVVGVGYACGQNAEVHLGLGGETACDLVVAWEGVTNTYANIRADQTFTADFAD